MAAYNSSGSYVLDELVWLEMIIRAYLKKWQKENKLVDYHGLYISEEKVEALLKGDKYFDDFAEIDEYRKQITEKRERSLQNGLELRLESLRRLFTISQLEYDIILVALAPELEPQFGTLYSYLQDNISRRKPSVELVLNLVCRSNEEKMSARTVFHSDSTLIQNAILHLEDGDLPLLEKGVKLDERIISYITYSDKVDDKITPFASLILPIANCESILTEPQLKQLAKLKTCSWSTQPVFLLQGPNNFTKVIKALCGSMGKYLLKAELEKIPINEFESSLKLLFREARMQSAVIYLEGFDALEDNLKKATMNEIIGSREIIFLACKTTVKLKRNTIRVIFPVLSFYDRKKIWESLIPGFTGVEELAGKFKFGEEEIEAAIEAAWGIARAKNPDNPILTLGDLYEGSRAQSGQIPFTVKVEPQYSWGDIVLSKDKKEQLLEICNYVKYYPRVFHDWGFDKHSRNLGLNVLFSGGSGTGKTMAAEVISRELGFDMYKIDLSMVVSKYVGETEKNLNRLFEEAEKGNAILFFDEADALFGKRSEIRDAHDRYANIEINYLLQKMEEHKGVVILATNLSKNLDDAFTRRMQFIIEFPFPDEEYRRKIWEQVYPEKTPRGLIDYSFLMRLKLSGGDIRNIALTSVFYAAENSDKVTMKHIVKAIKREYQKKGKVCEKEELGKYYELVN